MSDYRKKKPELVRGIARKSYGKCREKILSRMKEKYAANPRSYKNGKLKSAYGITLDEVERMLEYQGGVCAICATIPKCPSVDHDHRTGRVRGILCRPCNSALGLTKERKEVLLSMIEYLERTAP